MGNVKKIRSKVNQDFVDVCVKQEYEEIAGDVLFKFYRHYLNFGGSPNLLEAKKFKHLSALKRKFKHFGFIVQK